ncbi:hypothetical protein XM57_22820 [Burkholderia cepacia]|nr:hypothetical protein XM57_22820 [Burkholderia cepacia]ETP63653.1 hypothetical protein BDSB_16665 [Burkholderia dolosa PC543]
MTGDSQTTAPTGAAADTLTLDGSIDTPESGPRFLSCQQSIAWAVIGASKGIAIIAVLTMTAIGIGDFIAHIIWRLGTCWLWLRGVARCIRKSEGSRER